MDSLNDDSNETDRRVQPLAIRLSHWINIPLLVIMAGSGLQILTAYPALGPRGAQYSWYPFQNVAPPAWLTIGGWLGGGRHCPPNKSIAGRWSLRKAALRACPTDEGFTHIDFWLNYRPCHHARYAFPLAVA